MFLAGKMHTKCREKFYPLSSVKRLSFPDKLVPWIITFDNYTPCEYESKSLLNKPWADPSINDPSFQPKWNKLDGRINRQSYMGDYIIQDKRPLNPKGRTGLIGRGILGKWGPNHAADPIVTRWKIDDKQKKCINKLTGKQILQFCAIKRRDCGQWALPGGMVDPGEKVSETLKREFLEEALNSLKTSEEQQKIEEDMIKTFFTEGLEIYKGYVDDPRNTDNAWMETVAVNFHDEKRSYVGKLNLRAGDDAVKVKWLDIDKSLDLYASHSELLKAVVERLGGHW
ncbi:ADP-ribose pyrophosphatase, mitochondrial isoform X1 [Euwallacea fornicatus]|uniref:ADP-ribose pyrophosphatase, mitochondrial isoform X1 n=2 Tax=Euwallacea fornicatus TaxID=995702 RepID=UPI00338E8BC4